MAEDRDGGRTADDEAARLARLPPAAQRALKEAQARRREYERRAARMPREIGGRGGEEPVRYGDWEVGGLATDF